MYTNINLKHLFIVPDHKYFKKNQAELQFYRKFKYDYSITISLKTLLIPNNYHNPLLTN